MSSLQMSNKKMTGAFECLSGSNYSLMCFFSLLRFA